MNINEIHEHVWDIFVFNTENDYILYSKRINASHICPPKRNQLFKQRKWKSGFSRKHWLRPAKHESKSLFLWKPEMIPRSLRTFCLSWFPIKPRYKCSFWQKCWKWFLQKSGTHFRDNIRRFDVIPAANSMNNRSGLD